MTGKFLSQFTAVLWFWTERQQRGLRAGGLPTHLVGVEYSLCVLPVWWEWAVLEFVLLLISGQSSVQLTTEMAFVLFCYQLWSGKNKQKYYFSFAVVDHGSIVQGKCQYQIFRWPLNSAWSVCNLTYGTDHCDCDCEQMNGVLTDKLLSLQSILTYLVETVSDCTKCGVYPGKCWVPPALVDDVQHIHGNQCSLRWGTSPR